MPHAPVTKDSFEGLPAPDALKDNPYFVQGDFGQHEGVDNSAAFLELLADFGLADTVTTVLLGRMAWSHRSGTSAGLLLLLLPNRGRPCFATCDFPENFSSPSLLMIACELITLKLSCAERKLSQVRFRSH